MNHSTTWFAFFRYAVFALIAYSLAHVAIDQRGPGAIRGHGIYDEYVYTFGWPIVAASHQISEPILANPPQGIERIEYWNFNWWWVAVDAITLILIVFCSFAVAHKPTKFQFRQFSLASLLLAITIAALISPYEFDSIRRLLGSSVGSYQPITVYPLWLSIPVLCGTASVFFVMTNLTSSR